MSGMMFAIIAGVAASFFVDILGLMFLPNFLRRPKIKRNPNPDNEVLTAMLNDMESLGLINLKSGEDAIRDKRQAEHQSHTSKKVV
jgi:hypothetical protein